jgi:RNA polymerase sigma-70 factor, ECF subfamily
MYAQQPSIGIEVFSDQAFTSAHERQTLTANRADDWDWEWIRQRCTAEAAKIVRRTHDAEEVVQEALVRAWRGRSSCRTPEAPLPWCLQITRNEALRLLRRQRRDPLMDCQEQAEVLAEARGLGESDRLLLRLDVGRALELLTPRERLVLTLRYGQDWSHPEIARQLHIPEATARVWLYRANKHLRSALERS